MSATHFDSLEYYNQLKNAGVSDRQAHIQANAFSQLIENKLATKHDINRLENRMDHLECHVENRLKEFEERITYKLTVRCGGMMAASVTLLAVLIKIL